MNLISKWLEDYWAIPLTAIRLRILMSILIPICLLLAGIQIVLVLGIMSMAWLVTLGTLAGFIYPMIPITLSIVLLGSPLVKLNQLINNKAPKLLKSEAKFYFWILGAIFIAVHLIEIGLVAAVNLASN